MTPARGYQRGHQVMVFYIDGCRKSRKFEEILEDPGRAPRGTDSKKSSTLTRRHPATGSADLGAGPRNMVSGSECLTQGAGGCGRCQGGMGSFGQGRELPVLPLGNASKSPTLLLQNFLYMFLAPLTAAQNTVVPGMPPLLLPVRNVAAKHGGSLKELNRI